MDFCRDWACHFTSLPIVFVACYTQFSITVCKFEITLLSLLSSPWKQYQCKFHFTITHIAWIVWHRNNLNINLVLLLPWWNFWLNCQCYFKEDFFKIYSKQAVSKSLWVWHEFINAWLRWNLKKCKNRLWMLPVN